MRRLLICVLALALSACGSDGGPTGPTSTTRIIELSGSLNFEQVELGQFRDRTLTVRNAGTAALSVTGFSGNNASAFLVNPLTFTVAPQQSQNVTIRFTPTEARSYTGTVTVESNATSGTNTIAYAGTGINNAPIFSRSGIGNTVFDLPSYVGRVRVQAAPTTSCQNFIVRRNGPSFINTILGTCSVADVRTYDGTHLTPGGGTIEIVSSEGVNWTFTEIR